MEKIATDISTFSRLREAGFVYVDKTDALYAMASGEVGFQFFVACLRRFGKSLVVSTLKSLFWGERKLFEGLAIKPSWDWSKKWPVLHLDMGSAQTTTVPELNRKWRDMLRDECARNKIPFRDDENSATAFKNGIDDLAAASDDGQMVLLVDEYDKPLLGHLKKPDVAEFRDALKAFFTDIPCDMTDRQNEQMWQTICYMVGAALHRHQCERRGEDARRAHGHKGKATHSGLYSGLENSMDCIVHGVAKSWT